MRVAILASRDIFPVSDGAAMRIYDTATALGKTIDVVLYSPCFRLAGYGERGFVPDCITFRQEFVSGRIDQLAEMLPSKLMPVRFLLNYRPWWHYEVRARARPPDIVHAEQVFTAINGVMLKMKWRRPLVTVLHNVDFLLTDTIFGPLPASLERCLTAFAVKHSDRVVCVSYEDRDRLEAEIKATNIEVIPNSVNAASYVGPSEPGRVRRALQIGDDRRIVLFHGLLSYPPNREAVEVIVKEIAPRVALQNAKVVFVVIGAYPPFPSSSNVIFTGPVDNVIPYIQEASVCLGFLRRGSGTRLKILEYMACGKPVVATAKGAEGLDVEPGRNIVIANDVGDACGRIVELLEDDARCQLLGKQARELVEERYDWDVNARKYVDLYEELTRRNGLGMSGTLTS